MKTLTLSTALAAALAVATPAFASETVHTVQLDVSISFGTFLNMDGASGPFQLMELASFCELNDVNESDCKSGTMIDAGQEISFQT